MSSGSPEPAPLPLSRRLLFTAIVALVLLSAFEGLAFLTVELGGPALRAVQDDPTLTDPARIDDYLERRHDVLGWWPHPRTPGVHIDSSAARLSPAFPEPGDACLSGYGDSFAWGADVGDEAAWANQLARRLDCRVSNFGVPGYGVDQAVLRFELNAADEAPVVLLSIYPDDVLRNLTHNVGLVVHPSLDYHSLKPRFTVTATGGLQLHPIPFRTRAELQAYAAEPAWHLRDDWFSPNGYWARNRHFHFPYSYSIYQMLTGAQVRSYIHRARTGGPQATDYYRPGHPSRAFELTVALVQRFRARAAARGKIAVVMMFPDPDLARYYRRTGTWANAPLVDAVAQIAPTIDMGRGFMEALRDRDYQEIVHPGGHYTEEGNAMIADRVAAELARLFPQRFARTATTAR